MKTLAKTQTKMNKRRGQGMTEYIIIVALIAIAAIGVITLFGDNIRRLFGSSADALGGDTAISNPNTTSSSAVTKKKGLKDFGNQNTY
ncbi:MAG: hypothetical protein ACJ790_21060 [Myxococcaceae bacterium]